MEKNENFDDLAEKSTPIQYLLIGNISTNKIITEFSSTINSSKIKKEINQIFAKICKNQAKKYNERNKISSKDSIYYFTLVKPNYIFIILVDDDISEEIVFELIDKINEEKIITMVNEETQELNPNGRIELKNIIDSYQKKNEEDENEIKNENIDKDKNKIKKEDKNDINLKIDESKYKNNNNNINQSQTTEEIEDLQTKNDVSLLSNKSRKFDIRNIKMLQDYKMWLYMAAIILIILILVIII
jgi:hypothetical protein